MSQKSSMVAIIITFYFCHIIANMIVVIGYDEGDFNQLFKFTCNNNYHWMEMFYLLVIAFVYAHSFTSLAQCH